MGIKRQVCTALLELPYGITWVTVDKASLGIRSLRDDKVTMKYVKGWKRKFINMMADRSFEEIDYPLEKCYFFPNGFINGKVFPEKTTFIFGLCHLTDETKTREVKEAWKIAEKLMEITKDFENKKNETNKKMEEMTNKYLAMK